MMFEAICRCDDCSMVPSGVAQCERVMHTVPALYRTDQADNDGDCIFEEKLTQIAIGCTCALNPTS